MSRRAGAVAAGIIALAVSFAASGAPGAPHAAAQTVPTIDIITQTPFVPRTGTFNFTVKISGAAANEKLMIAIGRANAELNRIRQTRADLRRPDRPIEMIAGNVVSLRPEDDACTRDPNGLINCAIELGVGKVVLEPGVWPVAIGIGAEFRKPRQAIITQLVVVPDPPPGPGGSSGPPATPPVAVTVIVPITARPALRPDQQVRLDVADRTRLVTLADRVQALPTAVLAISPQLVEALDASVDPDDRALLDRLVGLAATREVMALPYTDIDEEAYRITGLVPELREQYTLGAARVRRVLGVEPIAGTAIVDASANTNTLGVLDALQTRLYIFNEDGLDALPSRNWPTPPTKRFEIEGFGGVGVSVDPELRRLFAGGDSVLNAQRLVADLSAVYFDIADSRDPRVREERHGVVVLVPDDWNVSNQFLGALTTGLQRNPILKPSGLQAMFDLSPAAIGGDAVAATPSTGVLQRALKPGLTRALDPYPERLRDTAARLKSLRHMVDSVDERIDNLLLVSGDSRLDTNERFAYLDEVNRYVDRFSKGLVISEVSRVTLTAQHDTLRLSIDNRLPTAVTVRVELRSDSRLDFPKGRVFDQRLAQGPNLLEIEVRSRATSETPVEVVLTSPAVEGSPGLGVLASTRIRVRSLALSGVGLALSIIAIAVLITWWIRNARAAKTRASSVAT